MIIMVIMIIVFLKKYYLLSLVVRVIWYTRPSEANCLWWFVGYLNLIVVIMVIMVIVVFKKNYFGGAWSFELLGISNLIGLTVFRGYGGYGGYLDFKEKIIDAGLGY